MNIVPVFRSGRAEAAVRWAVSSAPAHLSARGLAVPLWAALLPLLSP